MRTLVIQGDWLLRRAHFANLKMTIRGNGEDLYGGGIVGFVDKMRSSISECLIDKVVVVWDGAFDGWEKYDGYPVLKARKQDVWNQRVKAQSLQLSELSKKEQHEFHVLQQRAKLQGLLEEMGIRQVDEEISESTDGIAHYVKEGLSVGEDMFILCREHEFFQLISDRTVVIRYDDAHVTSTNFMDIYGYDPTNDLMIRCFTGMPSGVIGGVKGLTVKKMVHYFKGLKLEHYSYDDLISYARRKRVDVHLKTYDLVLSAHELVKRNARLINMKDPTLNKNLIEQTNYCLYSPLENGKLSGLIEMYEKNNYTQHIDQDIKTYIEPFQRVLLKEEEYKLFHEQINI